MYKHKQMPSSIVQLLVPAKTGADVATQIEEGDVCYMYYVGHINTLLSFSVV